MGAIAWTSMENAFLGCANLNSTATDAPDLSNVTSCLNMFQSATSFNGAIDHWDMSNITYTGYMFNGATSFNQDLNNWNLSNVNNMESMFEGASDFNGKVDQWNTSNVTVMDNVFFNASSFNQPVGSWNTSKVTGMFNIFSGASSFNQDISNWDMSKVTDTGALLFNAPLSSENYDKLLISWSKQSLQSGVNLFAPAITYCHGASARQSMITNSGWTVFDAGQNCTNKEFITTWQTTTANESITIPTTGTDYNYTVDWGDSQTSTGQTGDATHTYATAGTYTVKITGEFHRIYFNNVGDKAKIQTIGQWGTIDWSSMNGAFRGCSNLGYTATDAPSLSRVTDMTFMFTSCINFNGAIGNWNVSNVTNMFGLFASATTFNQDISNWDVSNVTNMLITFQGATAFNQALGNWNTSKVTNMGAMFSNSGFNQDISNWNVSQVTNMTAMFSNSSFNQNINGWNVSQVTNMSGMFENSSFNQDISSWNVSQVTNMSTMFFNSSFNQNIGGWNVGRVTNMSTMFSNSPFNQDISNWDVSQATSTDNMFNAATAFNQDISSWNTAKLAFTFDMFNGATSFNQNLGAWDVSQVTFPSSMFTNSAMSTQNYDQTLIGWSGQSLKSNVFFTNSGINYCLAATERQAIIDNFSWTITDGGSNCTLTNWNGTAWDNGTPTSSVSAAINGNYDANVNGDIDCANLGVKPSITLGIPTGDSVTAAGYLMNLGTITLQNDGAFVQTAVAPTNVGQGTYSVQRSGTSFNLEYNYWSSPLQEMTIGDAFGRTPNLYSFDAASQAWIAATSATVMTPGVGYIASGNSSTSGSTVSRTFSNNSGFNSGDITTPLAFSNDADATNDWNLIGNPYPSGIDVASFLATNYNGGAGTIDNAVYLWNSDGNDVGGLSSDYAIMNLAGVANAGGNTAPSSATISSGQGFIVRAIATGDVNFQNAQRGGTNNTFLRTNINKEEWKRVWINVSSEEGNKNEILIGFMPDAQTGKDHYDALKLAANAQISFYSFSSCTAKACLGFPRYAIQGLPLSETETIIPLGLTTKTASTYTFDISHLDQFEGMDIYLYDALTESSINLRTKSYTVDLAEGEYTERFSLRFIPARITSLEEGSRTEMKVKVYGANQQIYLQFSESKQAQAQIAVYDLMGRQLVRTENNNDLEVAITIPQTGVYIVRIENQFGVMSKKVLLR